LISQIAAWSRTEFSFECTLECVRILKANGLRDRTKRPPPLCEPATGFVQTKIPHEIPWWLPKHALEYLAEVTRAHARSASQNFYKKIGMKISNNPGNKLGEPVDRVIIENGVFV
jgi:hypothetical protein